MADDPRTEPLAKDLFERSGLPFPWAAAQQGFWRDTATAQLVTLDAVDPLRALLADEDRAVKRLRFAIADPGSFLARGDNYAEPITSWSARAVLAALREVAGL